MKKNEQINRSKMNINGFNVKLVVIDDVWKSGIPLIKLGISLTDFTMRNDHLENLLKAQVKINCNYFNYEIDVWEPVLENWELLLIKKLEIKKLFDTIKI